MRGSNGRGARLVARVALDPRGELRTLSRRAFFHVARHFTPVVAVDRGGVRFFVSTSEPIVGLYTFLTGGFEQLTMAKLFAALAAQPHLSDSLEGRDVV